MSKCAKVERSPQIERMPGNNSDDDSRAIANDSTPCWRGAKSREVRLSETAFYRLTSGHIPDKPRFSELEPSRPARWQFIVSRAGEALRCTSEKSKSEIPVENPWRRLMTVSDRSKFLDHRNCYIGSSGDRRPPGLLGRPPANGGYFQEVPHRRTPSFCAARHGSRR